MMDTACNLSKTTINPTNILNDPLLLSWYSLIIIVAFIYFLFIVVSVIWLIVLKKIYSKMKKQLANELDIENERYFQIQSKRKAFKLFIIIIIVELVIGILLFIPNLCMTVTLIVQSYMQNSLCFTYTINSTSYFYVYDYLISTRFTVVLYLILFYAYGLSILFQYGGFAFHTLTLAAIVQYYVNIYSSRRDTVPLKKYLIPAILQFLSIVILSVFIVTAPIITILVFIYYPVDLYFLIRNSRRLKHLLTVRLNEAALIGPEMLKEHENHLKYYKRIWGSFMISFVICIVSLILQCIITSLYIGLYLFMLIHTFITNFMLFNPIYKDIVEINLIRYAYLDILRVVTSIGYLQFILYAIISSIVHASIYLFKTIKSCYRPIAGEIQPLLEEYRNEVLARNVAINNQEEPRKAFENNYIASTYFAK